MSDSIQFGTLTPEGYTEGRAIPRSAIAACPQYILVPEHYREDYTCRCDEGEYDDDGNWTEF